MTTIRDFIKIVEAAFNAYHGTKSTVEFDAFSVNHSGSANPAFNNGQDFPAIWAAENAQTAAVFADADPHGRSAETGARIIPVIVHMDNPLIVDLDADKDFHRSDKYFTSRSGKKVWNVAYVKDRYLAIAKREGNDGVIFKNGYDGLGFEGDLYAVFDGDQMQFRMRKNR